jgi:hypothetical protein
MQDILVDLVAVELATILQQALDQVMKGEVLMVNQREILVVLVDHLETMDLVEEVEQELQVVMLLPELLVLLVEMVVQVLKWPLLVHLHLQVLVH